MQSGLKLSRKAGLLIISGGLVLSCFMVGAGLLTGAPPAMYLEIQSIKEIAGLWIIGALITAVFGTPVLLLIEKYFAHFPSRYVIGGSVAAWIAWFAMAGPLFNPTRWRFDDVRNWVGSGLGHVGIYVSLGLIVGTLFTIVVWLAERRRP